MRSTPSLPRAVPALLVAVLTLAAVALSTSTTWAAPAPVEVALTTTGTSPRSVTLEVGQELVVVNRDDERHRLRARDPEDVETGDLDPGASARLTISQTGTYAFVDERSEDPAFGLTVKVVAAGTSDGGSTGGGSTGGDSGGSSGGSGGSTTEAPATATVQIPDRLFSPTDVTIRVGGTVTWRNTDGSHTVTAVDRSFDSGIFDSGTWSRTFDAPGTYEYFCLLHPEMRGTVTVEGAGATGGTAPAPAPSTGGSSGSGSSTGGGGTGGGTAGGSTSGGSGTSSGTSGSGTATTSTATGSGPVTLTVDVLDFSYDPGGVEVPVGSTITWRNRGIAPHTVTGGGLDSGTLMTGDTYRRTFDSEGTFSYTCVFHPEMRGTVRVVAAGASSGARTIQAPAGTSSSGAATAAGTSGAGTSAPDIGTDARWSRATPAGAPATSDGPVVIEAADLAFTPATVEVAAGTTVTWELTDAAPHTVTADDGSFDSGMLDPGASFQHTFDTPGTYAYACLVHPGMAGTVVVTDGVAGTTDADASAGGGAGTPSDATSDPPAPASAQPATQDAAVEQPDDGLPAPTVVPLIALAIGLGVFLGRVVF